MDSSTDGQLFNVGVLIAMSRKYTNAEFLLSMISLFYVLDFQPEHATTKVFGMNNISPHVLEVQIESTWTQSSFGREVKKVAVFQTSC